jgi:UDP-N-acetyl-D-glucosamine dehydrogenase
MPFYPGPGVGGHCIPVDPYYLSWKAREYDFYTKFIELAAEVNQTMPYHVVDLAAQALGSEGKSLSGAAILILGVAFKRDIDDARNSPAERIIELLLRRGANVSYSDPHVPRYRVGRDVFCPDEQWLESVDLTDETLASADCIVIVAGHQAIDYTRIMQQARLIVDAVNITSGLNGTARVVRVGAPFRDTG